MPQEKRNRSRHACLGRQVFKGSLCRFGFFLALQDDYNARWRQSSRLVGSVHANTVYRGTLNSMIVECGTESRKISSVQVGTIGSHCKQARPNASYIYVVIW